MASAELSNRLAGSRLYLCTDSRREQGDLVDFVAAVIRGGVDIVQLREKGLEAREELELLVTIQGLAHDGGALFAVNDRADLARIAKADVLHLGQDDLTPTQARDIIGPDTVIGRSTHDPEQGDQAASDPDCDYYCVGPVWTTPTKPGRPAIGFGAVAAAQQRTGAARQRTGAAQQRTGKAWFAIGGIDSPTRVDEVIAAGAQRLVVVRAITNAQDPEAAARALRNRLPT